MFGSPFHDYWEPPVTAESGALFERLALASRQENQAAAGRLRAICELFELRRRQRGERADWAVDTWAAVGAEIAAALQISLAKAASYMNYGLAMLRLPAVAAVFAAGDIDMGVFQAIVYRTGLITDEAAMAAVDGELAVRVARWPSMTRGRLAIEIDRVVTVMTAMRCAGPGNSALDRRVSLWDKGNGTAELGGLLVSTDAAALDTRLDALARHGMRGRPAHGGAAPRRCPGGPRGGPAAVGLPLRDGAVPSGEPPANAGVVIHIVAEQATVEGRSRKPGVSDGGWGTLISAEMVAELARTARAAARWSDFTTSGAEAGYRPSRGFAEFVRARDLTCRGAEV